MANFPIDENQETLGLDLRKIETSDPVHADIYNALFQQLINNDAFLERLADKMIRQAMISHVLDSNNAGMVLGADVGPKITTITDGLQRALDVLNTKIACGELDLSAYGITSGQAVRINNVVIITFWHNAAVPTGKAINTVALPDDFRPQANKVGTAVYMDSSSTIALGTSIVKPDGHIYLDSAITRVRIEATIAYTIK